MAGAEPKVRIDYREALEQELETTGEDMKGKDDDPRAGWDRKRIERDQLARQRLAENGFGGVGA